MIELKSRKWIPACTSKEAVASLTSGTSLNTSRTLEVKMSTSDIFSLEENTIGLLLTPTQTSTYLEAHD